MRTSLWSKSVSRVEIDRRSRAARLRFERIDRLLIPRAPLTLHPGILCEKDSLVEKEGFELPVPVKRIGVF